MIFLQTNINTNLIVNFPLKWACGRNRRENKFFNSTMSEIRAIIHIDLDAFYAQIERVRMKLPKETPLVCCQWFGILAVSYSAREYGISRSTKIPEAMKLCPSLVTAHIPTYYFGEDQYGYHTNPQKATHKVSLDFYRQQSRKIMDIFKSECPKIEKASIDEAFMDVTDKCLEEMINNENQKVYWESTSNILGDDNFKKENPVNDEDLLLYYADKIARKMRKKVFDELGFTCSAGIAKNKTLAKLCSAMNKPDKQTVLRNSFVLPFLNTVSVSRIRRLGGLVSS